MPFYDNIYREYVKKIKAKLQTKYHPAMVICPGTKIRRSTARGIDLFVKEIGRPLDHARQSAGAITIIITTSYTKYLQ